MKPVFVLSPLVFCIFIIKEVKVCLCLCLCLSLCLSVSLCLTPCWLLVRCVYCHGRSVLRVVSTPPLPCCLVFLLSPFFVSHVFDFTCGLFPCFFSFLSGEKRERERAHGLVSRNRRPKAWHGCRGRFFLFTATVFFVNSQL